MMTLLRVVCSYSDRFVGLHCSRVDKILFGTNYSLYLSGDISSSIRTIKNVAFLMMTGGRFCQRVMRNF